MMLNRVKSLIVGLTERKLKALLKRFWNYYAVFSLLVGLSAIFCLTYFLLTSLGYCVVILEPITIIRVPEIIGGIISSPYYVIKIYMDFIKVK